MKIAMLTLTGQGEETLYLSAVEIEAFMHDGDMTLIRGRSGSTYWVEEDTVEIMDKLQKLLEIVNQ